MGVKKAPYQTKKLLLQNECTKRGIKFAVRWSTKDLQAALDGNRTNMASKSNHKKPVDCLPAACTCGQPIHVATALDDERRRDESMRSKSQTHHWDGVIFCGHKCDCGQFLTVRVPVKTRSIKCECGRPASVWSSDGKAECVGCALKVA